MVFFLKHLDYIYFFYGLSFILLAGVCFLLDRNKNKLMPWSLLILFGIFHGFGEWVSMMELSTGDFPFYDFMKISILLVSFIFLFEFGRTGLRAIYPKFFGGLSIVWQYGVLLMAVFAMYSFGVDDFDTSIRYVFGFSGGMISAALLFHYFLSERKCRYYFLVSAICLFLYSLASGLVVNRGSFFLCQYLNAGNFQMYAGFPVQILRAALVITLTVALWEYYCFMRKTQYNAPMDFRFGYGKWLTTAIIAVLCCGWLLTMIISDSVDRNQKEDFGITAEAIAAGISMENLRKLNGNLADLKTADYRIIQKYLREFEGSVKEIRWFYLTKFRGGKIYFILDSSPENKPDFSPPGTVYADAPMDLYGAFKDGKPVVCGPYSDKWGSFISAFIPIMDPETRKVDSVLGCDINSARWSQMISLSRLQPIMITLLICIILVIAFLMHQSSLEASAIISESEKKYRDLFNNSNDSIFILDLKGCFIEVNEVACGKFGYARDEFVRLSCRDIAPAGSGSFTSEKISQLNRETQFVFETSLLAKDRTSVAVEMNAKTIDYMGGECVLCIARDVSERKRIESVLMESEFRYRQLFNEMLSGFAIHEIICDDNGVPCDYRFLEINAAFEKITGLGRDKIIGKTVLEILPGTEPELISNLGDVAITGKPVFFENYHAGLDRYYEIRAFSHEKGKVAAVFNDITDRKREEEKTRKLSAAIIEDTERQKELQNQLAQSQKMESMGRLAGGIAHDFNNLIQVINGFTELIMMKIDGKDDIREDVEEIGKAGKRAKDLTNQLLLFSKRKPANITDVDVNALISNLKNMLLCGLGENIILETVFSPEPSHAKADPNRLEQVLLNLTLNAKDAMPDGGKLKITTGNIRIEDKDLISMNDVEAGNFVCISVSDTGAGMTPEVKAHLFEPFFSTKGRGKGTGLGLSVVYGIVKQHNGWLNVCSEKGAGTTFEIYLPASV